jgi:hypothetical protein
VDKGGIMNRVAGDIDLDSGRRLVRGAGAGQRSNEEEQGGNLVRLGRTGLVVSLLVGLTFTLSGCMIGMVVRGLAGGQNSGSEAATSYTPTVKLPESPKTIEAKVKLEPFANRIPIPGQDVKRGGYEVTSSGSMEGELTELVRQAILADFRINLVFSTVRIYEERPDLVIRGDIYQFAEYHSRPWYAKIPLVGRFASRGDQIEGGVKLTLVVSTPGGYPIGTYEGRAVFPGENETESDQGKKRRAPGEHLNRAFSEAVRQIRQQILADQGLTDGRWRRE